MNPTIIVAQFNKVTTLVDGGWRLSFDAGEDMAELAASLSRLRGKELFLSIVVKAEETREPVANGS